jgi:trimeric autotransporter adhesin
MSTKTTFKRVALVVVAALGFGVLTSVAPATAAPQTATSVVVGTVPTGRVGVTSSVPFKIYTAGLVAADTLNISAEITSAPLLGGAANAASALGSSGPSATIDDNDTGGLMALSSSSSSTAAFGAVTTLHGRIDEGVRASGIDVTGDTDDTVAASHVPLYVITAADVAAGYITAYVRITPDVAGSFTVMVSATNFGASYGLTRSATVNQLYSAGDISASFTFTTAGAPSSVTLTQAAGGTIHAGSTYGVPVAVTVNGTLGSLDSIDLTTSGSGTISLDSSSYATTKSLTSTQFAGGATAIVWLKDTGTTAATISLKATSSGALAAFSASKTFSVQAATGSATALVNDVYGSTTTYGDASAAITGAATPYTVTVATTSTGQTLGWSWAGAAATKGYVTVTDTAGVITGIAGLVWDESYALAATDEGLSLSFAGNANGLVTATSLYSVVVPVGAAATTVGMAAATTYNVVSADKSSGAFTITPTTGSSSYQVAPGAGIAMTAQVKDQYGVAWASKSVTITTSGRNNPTATTAVTDASGKVTFTSADTSTSTTNIVDSVTFTSTVGGTITAKTITLNYGNTAPSTVLLTAGSTTLGVTSLTTTYLPIAAGKAGPSGTLVTVSATVADASANAIAGTPVTWTIAGTGCAIPTNKVTSYTAATGIATSSAYAWITGTCTVTATAGTKTGTASLTWRSETASQARTVSAAVNGTVVTATVKDRFGNGVKGVTVYATKSGAAYFGAGIGRTSSVTDANGNAEFSVAGGSASVTVSVIDYDAASGAVFGQTCALAGNHTCATASTAAVAFTATTVGTATTAETGVGASFAPAGVASATVSVTGDTTAADNAQAATDAAAEATDAANAATDAANAAAEAADAATAAAQDAADAVAALSAQVATLISGLKAQLTALTNLVIKIQKKVKA